MLAHGEQVPHGRSSDHDVQVPESPVVSNLGAGGFGRTYEAHCHGIQGQAEALHVACDHFHQVQESY